MTSDDPNMALADEIRDLAGLCRTALDASHDYFTYSKRVWRLLYRDLKKGRTVTFRNPTTGTTATGQDLPGLAQQYITDYLNSFTFQHFVSLFEDFFFGLLRLWLGAYPASLSRRQLDFGTVLQASDKAAITFAVVDKELNELKYERVADWFAYLDKLVKLGCLTRAEIEKVAEIKASRDVLIHNKGIANAVYVSKAGRYARCREGERLEVPEPYHRESWEMVASVVRDVADAAARKA